ncbi:MAG TPA: 16S rRNA (uracil(1498)-N(3))-methyltransferase [Desulfobacteraceae bacterium]|nr:16S rRNA (uracil(1498)-N(3))-methyltransferase [Desulfobacteraceae bacterium]
MQGLRRFFVEEIIDQNGLCSIKGTEAKHIAKVLRMRPGDHFVLMDNNGRRFQAVIDSVNPREVIAKLEKSLPNPPTSPIEIILCQALLKSAAMDYIIQKASELGVESILPFSSIRSVSRPEAERVENRVRHWREIARSSAKQSGRHIPAKIASIFDFEELMETWKGIDACKVIFWEDEGSKDLKGILRSVKTIKKFVGVVGPEGGFEKDEVKSAMDAGFITVSLGNRILRSETAAVAFAAIVQYELGDLVLL